MSRSIAVPAWCKNVAIGRQKTLFRYKSSLTAWQLEGQERGNCCGCEGETATNLDRYGNKTLIVAA
jgi:hypothetical protein